MTTSTFNDAPRGSHLDLFSGVGGFALAAEAAGYRTVAFAEPDPYAQQVLGRHWPDRILFDDVRQIAVDLGDLELCETCGDYFCALCGVHFYQCDCLTDDLAYDRLGPINLITAGWPCSDFSKMGRGAGLAGARSGLWSEVRRIVGAVRPGFVLLENTANLLYSNHGREFGVILGDLAALGYGVEWRVLRGHDFGVRQKRERLFALAYDPWRIGEESHKRALMPTGIRSASFGGGQPLPLRGRIPHGPADRLDIGQRISLCSNAIIPNVAFRILDNLPTLEP